MKKMRRSLARAEVFEGGVQPSGAVIFLSVFGQPVATHRRTRLEGVLAVLGEIRGGGPVWDVESGGTVCVLVADCQRPQSRARLKPETMIVTFEEFRPAHDFFDYTRYISGAVSRTLPLVSRTAFVVKDATRESLFIHRSTCCSEKIGLRLVLTSHTGGLRRYWSC